MIRRYNQYIREKMDHSELDPFGEEDWVEYDFNIGDKVICTNDCCIYFYQEKHEIKRGQIKIIQGIHSARNEMYFTDTKTGIGTYEMRDFKKI